MKKEQIEDQRFDAVDYTADGLPVADYEGCTFANCTFFSTDLSEVNFTDCVFEHCDLSMAKLKDAVFRDVKFTNCKLLGLRFDECNSFNLSFSFDNCVLNFASFFRLNVKNTVFDHCKLEEVEFVETDLSNAVFSHCDLTRAIFGSTRLNGADFRTAYNFSIDPEENSLKKARFSAQNLAGLLDKYQLVIA